MRRWNWWAVGALAAACAAPRPATEDDVVRLEPAALAGDRAAIRALFEVEIEGGHLAEVADDIR